jgi:hypothetical protein
MRRVFRHRHAYILRPCSPLAHTIQLVPRLFDSRHLLHEVGPQPRILYDWPFFVLILTAIVRRIDHLPLRTEIWIISCRVLYFALFVLLAYAIRHDYCGAAAAVIVGWFGRPTKVDSHRSCILSQDGMEQVGCSFLLVFPVHRCQELALMCSCPKRYFFEVHRASILSTDRQGFLTNFEWCAKENGRCQGFKKLLIIISGHTQ